jgi:glucose 1-dehydrogenase
MPLEQFDGVLGADLVGPFLACRRFVRGLAAGGGGRIVNVSSIHERAPRCGRADYDSAKGGLAQLTATLALELAPQRIAVNAVAPGMILTPMNQSALDDPAELRRKERRSRGAVRALPRGRRADRVPAVAGGRLPDRRDRHDRRRPVADGGRKAHEKKGQLDFAVEAIEIVKLDIGGSARTGCSPATT